MPKPRIIDTDFWNDPDVANLTRDERLLLTAMITTCADDYGRMMAHAAYLRKQAFGYDDDVTVNAVQKMRDHIVETCRNVVLYEVDGQEYIWLRRFQKHQKIRHHVKSKLPPFPEDSDELPKSAEHSHNLPKSCAGVVLSSVELSSEERYSDDNNNPPERDEIAQNLVEIGFYGDMVQDLTGQCVKKGWTAGDLDVWWAWIQKHLKDKKRETQLYFLRDRIVRNVRDPPTDSTAGWIREAARVSEQRWIDENEEEDG